ncbi:uncharacterized protein C45G9.7 isoform X2 [Cephus cinctus]|uniref:Uncharacterized protein C45G9.7 isoform X2 n=1 Tax=Cephus cinctus TaxID=211228 RepID=A0AAJ7W0Q2_CEPCN|nr:uncharacterized protein C45G9.7 isoform X2 [Cephus cinctus]
MCAKMAFQHQAGTAMECLSIPITLHKEPEINANGEEVMKCGFKIGGGIDQDFRKSPQGYTDNMIFDQTPVGTEMANFFTTLRRRHHYSVNLQHLKKKKLKTFLKVYIFN